MNKCIKEFKLKCKSLIEGDRDIRKYVADYRRKCRIMLDDIEIPTHSCRSYLMQLLSTDSVRDNLIMYGEPGIVKPLWIDDDLHRSKLLVEFTAHIKIPVLSEKAACDLLMDRSAPEMPAMLTDFPLDRLEPDDIQLSYWYWSSVGKGTGMYDKARCSVALEARKNKPNEMRSVWALPLLVIVEETRYAFPLISSLKRGECGRSTGYALDKGRTCMLDLDEQQFDFLKSNYPSDYQFMVVNYRVFDSVVPNWIIELCFDVLVRKLDFSTETQNKQDGGGVKKVYTLENRRRFRMVVEYFLKIPIEVRGDPDYMIEKARGIPLGSYFSNLIRTMSNFVMTRILCNAVFHEDPFLRRFNGSKCVMAFRSYITLDIEAYSRCAKEFFGVIVDPNRTCIAANVEDFHALGYCCDDRND